MTRRDPWINAMRATAGVAAAGLGGADAVTVLPMTLTSGLPDAAARRLARNTSRVLIDEAHLARVDDAGGGAGAIEALTSGLCETAWTLFQEIEARGGLPAAGALLRARIAATARERAAAVATLARGIVGTSRYPSLDAPAVAVLDVPRRPAAPPGPEALPCVRDAEPFEALRDRAEARATDGRRPLVFLATLGTPAGFGARATFAANLLAAAGLATTAPDPMEADDLVARFKASGAAVACLCGRDDSYRESGAGVLAALRSAGATLLLMAGRDEDWRKEGVDALIHERCPALQVLESALEKALAPAH